MDTILVVSDYANIVSARPEAELFISLHHRGWKLVMLVPNTSPWLTRFMDEGMIVEPYDIKGRSHPEEVQRIKSVLAHFNVSLMLLFNNRAVVNGVKAAQKHSVRVIVYRGSVGNVHWYDPTSYLKVLHPRVDGVLCLHDAVKAHLDKQMVFRSIQTEVMRKGHKAEWYVDVQAFAPTELSLPDDGFFVVFVGNVRRVKGLSYLLKATQWLAKNPKAHLLLVGKGMDKAPYEAAIQRSPMRDRIHRLGFRSDAPRIVAMSNVLVLPSLRSEALTKAVQEAMQLGVCPVITDIPGNRGLVVDQECGRVVPIKDARALGEALLACSLDPKQTKMMGVAARDHIRQWLSHEQTVAMAERALRRFLTNGKIS